MVTLTADFYALAMLLLPSLGSPCKQRQATDWCSCSMSGCNKKLCSHHCVSSVQLWDSWDLTWSFWRVVYSCMLIRMIRCDAYHDLIVCLEAWLRMQQSWALGKGWRSFELLSRRLYFCLLTTVTEAGGTGKRRVVGSHLCCRFDLDPWLTLSHGEQQRTAVIYWVCLSVDAELSITRMWIWLTHHWLWESVDKQNSNNHNMAPVIYAQLGSSLSDAVFANRESGLSLDSYKTSYTRNTATTRLG